MTITPPPGSRLPTTVLPGGSPEAATIVPFAGFPLTRFSCMFDGPNCINCNFVRRVTVRWFNRALVIVIIYWLSVMYLLVTKC